MCHGVRFLWSTSSSQVLQPIHMCKQNNNRKNRIISRILPDMICEITGIQLRLSSKYDLNLVMHPLRNIECPVFLCVIHQETPDEVACHCVNVCGCCWIRRHLLHPHVFGKNKNTIEIGLNMTA